jgi:L-aspartate oxidase
MSEPVDLVVVGSGIAGLTAALAARRAGLSVVVVTKSETSTSATRCAQAGIAVAPEDAGLMASHIGDTLRAGSGTCDGDAVEAMVRGGPEALDELVRVGVIFDRDSGGFARSREGGHSEARVVHAGGDATGVAIERALVGAVEDLDIDVRPGSEARKVELVGDRAVGVLVRRGDGTEGVVAARHTLLATGGAGQCYAVTTNPLVATGDGVAIALRAGAAVADLEFMQFHPTALHSDEMPRPLVSEALRGEGAVLRDERGRRFMVGEHRSLELAPRDVIARVMTTVMLTRGLEHLWLDATMIERIPERFPTVWTTCRAMGIDARHDWIPVAPAAHYSCGGVCTDLDGATTIPGLWAAGEAACTGAHGANRLASNSLLEGAVFGRRVVDAIVRRKEEPEPSGALRGIFDTGPAAAETGSSSEPLTTAAGTSAELRSALQAEMTVHAGVLRDEPGLAQAERTLAGIDAAVRHSCDGRDERELGNLLLVARVLVRAARARRESRGTHTRFDAPDPADEYLGRFVAFGPYRLGFNRIAPTENAS